jgi:2-keto-4-pentenoate hydratase/2-oxohepta-3-ene-1,7-dioic acid hydratase in catechol pathway
VRLANVADRATIVTPTGGIDVYEASKGEFGPELTGVYDRWLEFSNRAARFIGEAVPIAQSSLRSPVPSPRQVFAIGLNYASHAQETGLIAPDIPATFTKFPASLAGPYDDVELSGDSVDWEVELVVVMGTVADRVEAEDAWTHVAGLTVGQDISDRTVQFAAGGQFSLGKSFRGFGPLGPYLVTQDEVTDPDDLALGCSINGEVVQEDRTSGLIFPVSQLIAQLSAVLSLYPGDLIFTGTPAGVGVARQPQRFLASGDVLESWIENVGTIRNRIVATAR